MTLKIYRIFVLSLFLTAAVFGQPENDSIARARAALNGKDYAAALREADAILQASPRSEQAAFIKADALLAQNKLDESLAVADFALGYLRRDFPDKKGEIAGFLNLRGSINFKKKNYQIAANEFSEAIQLNPNFAQAYLNRANTAVVLKSPFEAIDKDYRKAYQLDNKMTGAVTGLVRACSDEKIAPASCVGAFNELIILFPTSALGYWSRGLYNLRKISNLIQKNSTVYKERAEQTIKDFRKALELEPDSVSVNRDLGRAYFYLNNYDEAAKNIEKALSIDPKNAVALFYRGDLLSERGDDQAALRDFAAAEAITKNIDKLYASRGKIYQKQGKIADALREFTTAAELNPNEDNLWLKVYALYQKGDYAPAYAEMKRMKGFYEDSSYSFGFFEHNLPLCRVNYVNADLRQRLNASSTNRIADILSYAAGQGSNGYDENDKQCVAEAVYKYVDLPGMSPRGIRNALNSLRDRNISAPNLEEKIRVAAANADAAERREMADARTAMSNSSNSSNASAPTTRSNQQTNNPEEKALVAEYNSLISREIPALERQQRNLESKLSEIMSRDQAYRVGMYRSFYNSCDSVINRHQAFITALKNLRNRAAGKSAAVVSQIDGQIKTVESAVNKIIRIRKQYLDSI